MKRDIQIISAPSILGLKPGGVEHLGDSLLAVGLTDRLQCTKPVINVPTQNSQYSFERDKNTGCLNPAPINEFSLVLLREMSGHIDRGIFTLVLGGDCSILLGIMPALKTAGKYGLIFLDAHADFYEPSTSPTGEVADMDLAIVTGRGPALLTNIGVKKPYVEDKNVIHIGQRDASETKKYKSQDIKDSSIKCFDLQRIKLKGLDETIDEVLEYIHSLNVHGFWIHFDADVLNDDENPAVDYRLPGGLRFAETTHLLNKLLEINKIAGMSVTIFNPGLDASGEIAGKISDCIAAALG